MDSRSPGTSTAQFRGAICGLTAAMLFGLSAPLSKRLLGEISPILLAGLLYLGAATGLWIHRALVTSSKEAPLGRGDVPKLAGVVFFGGLLGPVLMLLGLSRVTALTGSLLLNFEAPLTVLLAVVVFREHLGKFAALAVGCVVLGAAILRVDSGTLGADWLGVLAIVTACLCWAVDNNLTQRLSLKNPFSIVRIKTTVSGVINTVLGTLILNEAFPAAPFVVGALVLGSLSYGLSVVLDAFALRFVGAAREAAYFSTAPFVGAVASVFLLGEPLRWLDGVAMSVMGLGVFFLMRERHAHEHAHETLEHEHLHEHDEHHQHEHPPGFAENAPHSHPHRHENLVHSHAHVPDVHHRHRH